MIVARKGPYTAQTGHDHVSLRLAVPCGARPPFLFGQLCVAEGEGVGAVLADPEPAAVVPDAGGEVSEDEGEVAALATARLAPNPAPSAPAPTAVTMMILPSLVLNVSASLGRGWVRTQENHAGFGPAAAKLSPGYESPGA
jgi:hypothetical protein